MMITSQIIEILKLTSIRKLCLKSSTYNNFNLFGPLEHEALDFKEF